MIPTNTNKKQSSLIVLGLRTLAAVTSVATAVAAYPIAEQLFGTYTGGIIVAATEALIYAGWHYVGTEQPSVDSSGNPDNSTFLKQLGVGVMAFTFSAITVAGIYASTNLNTAASQAKAAQEADVLYAEQEKSRIVTLDRLTEELRVTSKNRNSMEYAELQAQIKALSQPTTRSSTATEAVATPISTNYRVVSASAFSVITLCSLIMAGLFSRRKEALPAPVMGLISPTTPVNPTTTPPNNSTTPTDTPQTPLEAIEGQDVPANDEGYISIAGVMKYTSCTNRAARDAISAAVNLGALIKEGDGPSTRYRYPSYVRPLQMKVA